VPSLIFPTLDIHRGTRGRSALSRYAHARPHQVRSTCAHIELSMSLDIEIGASGNPGVPRRAEDGARGGSGARRVRPAGGHTRTRPAAAGAIVIGCVVLANRRAVYRAPPWRMTGSRARVATSTPPLRSSRSHTDSPRSCPQRARADAPLTVVCLADPVLLPARPGVRP